MKSKKSEMSLRRPVVWVTGASRGIGREIAKEFASIGCVVCLSGRNAKELGTAVREITAYGGRGYAFPLDITSPQLIRNVHRSIRKQTGAVDVLINNAGISSFKSFLDTSTKEFGTMIGTNLLGHVACMKEVLPSMIERKGGWIINIVSMVAVKTYEGSSAYTASKAGMLGLARVLREELKPHGIKIVNVLPGATDTGIWHPTIREKYRDRMMNAKSVAQAVLSVYGMPDDVVVDEIVVRPMLGDLS